MYHSCMTETSPGGRLRHAVEAERPLQIAGAVNAYTALLAERAGFRALYLSGAGVANASFGLPGPRHDEPQRRLRGRAPDLRRHGLPLLVDADTGWGAAFSIARTTRELIRAGAAGMHLEDQVQAKRCGHRPGQGAGGRSGDGGSHPCGRGRSHRRRLRRSWHAPTRTRSRDSGPRSTAPSLRRGGRRHDLRRGADDARRVPRVHARAAGAGPRQHHRVRRDAAVHDRGARAAPACGSCSTRCRPFAP